jgi:hypothetical protein
VARICRKIALISPNSNLLISKRSHIFYTHLPSILPLSVSSYTPWMLSSLIFAFLTTFPPPRLLPTSTYHPPILPISKYSQIPKSYSPTNFKVRSTNYWSNQISMKLGTEVLIHDIFACAKSLWSTVNRKAKTSTPRIPMWSPTMVLTKRCSAWLRRSDGMRYFLSPMAEDTSMLFSALVARTSSTPNVKSRA